MARRSLAIALAAGLSFAAPAAAQPAMNLAEALAYARAHQPSLQAAQARVEVARRGVAVARSEWLPQLGATAQIFGGTMNNTTAMFVGVRGLDVPRIGASVTRADAGWSPAYPSTLVAVGLRQLVLDFGRVAAQAAVATAQTEALRDRARGEWLEVALQVEDAYYAVRAAHAVERVATEAHRRALLRRDLIQASVSRGLRPALDITRVDADVTRFAVGLTRARGAVEGAQAIFAAAVGTAETLLDAAEDPAAERGAAGALPPLGAALQDALTRDPRLREALSRLREQQAQTRAISAGWVPTLQLNAGISGRAGGAPVSSGPSGSSGWLPEVPNWDVGLVLGGTIFDGTILARREQSRAAEELRRREVDLVRRQLLAVVQRAFTTFRVAQAALTALTASAEAARRNYEQAEARMRAGLSNNLELADAEALRIDAEMQLAVGRFDIARARATFNRAIARGL